MVRRRSWRLNQHSIFKFPRHGHLSLGVRLRVHEGPQINGGSSVESSFEIESSNPETEAVP
ncbi:hypothetical protein AVEN_28447-1, partial [Araneus ventricosus]